MQTSDGRPSVGLVDASMPVQKNLGTANSAPDIDEGMFFFKQFSRRKNCQTYSKCCPCETPGFKQVGDVRQSKMWLGLVACLQATHARETLESCQSVQWQLGQEDLFCKIENGTAPPPQHAFVLTLLPGRRTCAALLA